MKSTEERFWEKVQKTNDCWIWLGSKRNGQGEYGQFRFRGKREGAHRVSWILHHGEIPNELNVCHTCDNRICVRPDHFFLGTDLDNMRDCIEKGRHARTTLDWNKVRFIRAKSKEGLSNERIGHLISVGTTAVRDVVLERRWNE